MSEQPNTETEATAERTPQRKMSPADRAVLLDILKRPDVRVDGKIHVATVSRLTGLSLQAIYSFLRSDKYLKSQVAEVRADLLVPDEADAIDRDPQPTLPLSVVNFTGEDVDQAGAVRKQNLKMLAGRWQELGLSPKQAEAAEKYCTLGGAPTYGVLRLVGGQLISNMTLLDEIIKADSKRVLDGNLPAEVDKDGNPRDPEEVERDWRYMVYAGMNLQLSMFSHLHKSQAILARVAADLQKLNSGTRADEKGDFQERGAKKKK